MRKFTLQFVDDGDDEARQPLLSINNERRRMDDARIAVWGSGRKRRKEQSLFAMCCICVNTLRCCLQRWPHSPYHTSCCGHRWSSPLFTGISTWEITHGSTFWVHRCSSSSTCALSFHWASFGYWTMRRLDVIWRQSRSSPLPSCGSSVLHWWCSFWTWVFYWDFPCGCIMLTWYHGLQCSHHGP